jgi:inhibitor of KinA
MNPELIFHPLGDQAVLVSFGNSISQELSQKVYSLYYALRKNADPSWLDIIPAYASVTVLFDAKQLAGRQSGSPYEAQVKKIRAAADLATETQFKQHRKVRIPVCYHPDFALDSANMCKRMKLTEEALINLHTEKSYFVYMIGFLPGFAYMGSVDPRMASPRLDKPRTLVPKGSVGIAGFQTGIYPFDSPGGWNIIGRTPLSMFDLEKEEPVLLQPGDEVRFYAINKSAFNEMQQQPLSILA